MPNWKKLITSGSDAALNGLTLTGALSTSAGVQFTGISTQNSEVNSLMITTGGVVGYRTLGDNAFNSNAFLTTVDLTSDVTNELPVTNGGTNATNAADARIN